MDSRVSSPPLLPQAVYSHSKVTLTCRPAKPLFVAGQPLDGILELACSSDKVWLGGIALEVRGAEQLHSRDHAASQAFMQSDVTFQSAKLPPSNAVIASSTSHSGFWPARKGVTRFPFTFAIPAGCPSSCKFAGNASVTYTLLASCQIQLDGERSILTRRLDVNVIERWQDWQYERYHEPAEAQVRERIQSSIGLGGLGKNEGTVTAQALIQDPLFYRGWELPDGSLEIERARGQICTHLSITNATPRTISGLKVSLIRRLKILPDSETPTNQTLVISAASAPRITETVEELNLHGRGWEFPPSDQDTVVDCIIPLPIPEKFLSVRKTKLFEIQTLLKLTLDMGTLHKPISFELPIWVAHWASLPSSALQVRQIARPPILRTVSSQGSMRPRSAMTAADNGNILDTFDTFRRRTPFSRSPLTSPQPMSLQCGHVYAPSPHEKFLLQSAPVDLSFSEQQLGFIPFDPHVAAMTPSRFINQDPPWLHANQDARHYAPSQSPSQMAFVPISLASSAPASSYFQMLAQERMTLSPKLPESLNTAGVGMLRSHSADSRLSISNWPCTPRALPPGMQERLTEEEQARVLANSAPAVYDVNQRAYALQQQQEQQNISQRSSPSGNASFNSTGRQRRQSMPTPPSAVQGRFSPLDATPSRPIKTPPLAPSSRFTFQLPFVPSTMSPEQAALVAGLETIGEDGESQAGTLRLGKGTLRRSASHEQIKSLKAVRAATSAIDEEGNTSVSLLEGIAERQDREKEAANRREELVNQSQTNLLAGLHSPNMDKTLPNAPMKSEKASSPESSNRGRKGIFDVFPEITTSNASPAKKSEKSGSDKRSPGKLSLQTRAVSGPAASNGQNIDTRIAFTRPVFNASKSESLLALESRLSRPNSPMSPTFGNDRPPSLSPPPRSDAISPVQRAISPAHIGNQGALRKKSSQLSLKRQTRQQTNESKTEFSPKPDSSSGSLVKATSRTEALPQSRPNVTSKRLPTKTDCAESALKVAKSINTYAAPVGQNAASRTGKDRSVRPLKYTGFRQVMDTPLGSSAKVSPTTMPPSPQRKTAALAPRSPAGPLAHSSPASPSKRHSSDPQTRANPQTLQKPAVISTRRQSLDIPSGSIDKFGSARGGRGGVVTNVASLWTNKISQEAQNAKYEATFAKSAPLKSSHRTVASKAVTQPVLKAETELREAITSLRSNRKEMMEIDSGAAKATTETTIRRPTPQAPKAKQAVMAINATMGKPPTFAKSLKAPTATAAPLPAEASSSGGQGTSNLRALIAKFS